jgi:asparagine synthase (glutamine-hydrolysing)
VDSALICAIASSIDPELDAVTVGFERGDLDEAPVAARIARNLKLRHRVLRFDRTSCLAAFERFSRGAEQPAADPAATPTLLAFESCRNEYDTVLDGTGADELVGAMPPRHVRAAVEYGSLLPRPVRRVVVKGLRMLPAVSGYAPIFDFEHPAEMLIRWHGFTREEVAALCGERVSFEHTLFFRTFAGFPRGDHYERYRALLATMPSDRLHQAARMTGIYARFPYLEREIAGFVKGLPIDYVHAPNQPKRILRALLARYVPRSIWDSPKHGFDFPLHEFLSADDFLVVRRGLARERWAQRGILDPVRVAAVADRFIAGERALAFKVLALAVLDLWLDSHDFQN